MAVTEALLLSFFQESTKALQKLQSAPGSGNNVEGAQTDLSGCRKIVLETQQSCLERVVKQYNSNDNKKENLTTADFQKELQKLGGVDASSISADVKTAMSEMNDAARLSLCSLILYSEYVREVKARISKQPTKEQGEDERTLKTSGNMNRSEIMEFCGLCNAAIKLDSVKKHLSDGKPLFDVDEILILLDSNSRASSLSVLKTQMAPMFPAKRLEKVQHLLMRSLGYDEEYGAAELKRIFAPSSNSDHSADDLELRSDRELVQTFAQACSNSMTVVANSECEKVSLLSDQDTQTRVVSVNYSETVIDPSKDIDTQLLNSAASNSKSSNTDGAIQKEEMDIRGGDADELRKKQLQLAKEAAMLQQSILQELQSMSIQDRQEKLDQAKRAEQNFMEQAMQVPAGPERIQFLRNIDHDTQKLLAMNRIWQTASASTQSR